MLLGGGTADVSNADPNPNSKSSPDGTFRSHVAEYFSQLAGHTCTSSEKVAVAKLLIWT
jgi:hypothetical protein